MTNPFGHQPPRAANAQPPEQGGGNSLIGTLRDMYVTFISDPSAGSLALVSKRTNESFSHAIAITLATGIFYVLVPYILIGDLRDYVDLEEMIKIAVPPMLFIAILAAVSLLVKKASSLETDFRSEFFTGALSGFPLCTLLVFVVGFYYIADLDVYDIMNPERLINKSLVFFAFIIYIILSIVEIFRQSLSASGAKSRIAFYASPAAVIISCYLTFKVIAEIS